MTVARTTRGVHIRGPLAGYVEGFQAELIRLGFTSASVERPARQANLRVACAARGPERVDHGGAAGACGAAPSRHEPRPQGHAESGETAHCGGAPRVHSP